MKILLQMNDLPSSNLQKHYNLFAIILNTRVRDYYEDQGAERAATAFEVSQCWGRYAGTNS
jgi:hypothetical protein